VQAFISAPSPLLPNLRSLYWRDNQECFVPLLRTLLGPTITSLKLDDCLNYTSFAKLLASLGARCPYIRELQCLYDEVDSEEISDAICEALCGLKGLLRLKTDVLNTRALGHLAPLPSLQRLHLDLSAYNADEPQSNIVSTFSSHFDHVRFTIPIPFIFSHCLNNVRFLSCRSVTVRVDYEDPQDPPYDPSDAIDLISSFSKCFSPTLEHIRFKFDFPFSRIVEEDVLANPLFALHFDAIAPLLSFGRLTNLDLDWICASAIHDASLKSMAQSWPHLENFRFGSSARWVVVPSLTFVGLVHLIHHCQRLRSIAMPFCACPVDANSEPFSETIPNEKITALFVGVSPIVDPISVACQLHTLLPKLTSVGFSHFDTDFSIPPPFEHVEDDWRRVNDFLKVLFTNAQMKRSTGQAH
jgi:hypothetical protein